MEVRLFDKQKDYETIVGWWIKYDKIPSSINLLPSIGYIVDGLAAGFLYQTDSDVVFIEELIANKDSEEEQRHKAIDLVVESLINCSIEMGYKKIIFHTTHPRIKQRSMDKWQAKEFIGSKERLYRSL